MRSLRYRLLGELMKNKIENVFLAPVWILKCDRVLHEDRFYLKVYFFANVEGMDIQQLRFNVTYEDRVVELKANEFIKAETYPEDPVFGCVLTLPEDYPDCEFNIYLTGIFVGRRFEDYTGYERGFLYFNVFIPTEKVRFLQRSLPHYMQFPRVGETYWQCSCGHHNLAKNTYCIDCLNEKTMIDEWLAKGEDRLTLELHQKKTPLVYNRVFTLEESLNHYVRSMTELYAIEEVVVREVLDLELAKQAHHEGKLKDDEFLEKQARDTKNQKRVARFVFFSFLVLLFVFGLVVPFGTKAWAYGEAVVTLSKKDFEASLQQFTELKGFLNSEAMLNEVYLKWAEDEYELDPTMAIWRLENMPNPNYKDAKIRHKTYINEYAESRIAIKMYEEAALYFGRLEDGASRGRYHEALYQQLMSMNKIDVEDAKTMTLLNTLRDVEYKDIEQIYSEAHYALAIMYIEGKRYEEAIRLLDRIRLYKDSLELLLENAYLYGKQLFEEKKYSLAIEQFKLSVDYADSKDWLNETRYQYGLSLIEKNGLELAFRQFQVIRGYKDADRYFTELENEIYDWEATVFINSDSELLSEESSVSKAGALYIHFVMHSKDKDASITPIMVYYYPDKSTWEEAFDGSVKSGEASWIGWDDSIYIDPEQGETGIFKVEILDPVSRRVLGSDSILITD